MTRGLDERLKRLIRAEAMRRGLKLAQAIKEAFQLWRSFDQEAEVLSEREINNATYSALLCAVFNRPDYQIMVSRYPPSGEISSSSPLLGSTLKPRVSSA